MKRRLLCCVLLLSWHIFAETPQSYYAFGGLPAINYSSDAGLGLGVVASMYRKTPKIKPYYYAIDAQIFFTTLGQHSHYVKADWLEAFSLPLRLRGKIGFYHTTNENYCGQGVDANCFQTIPQTVADATKYFYFRYFEIYGTVDGRWRLLDLPHKIELMAGWRGSYYLPGTWGDYTPYPGSLYAEDFPSIDDNKGFASVFEGGVMFDGRDNEPAPSSGYWVEATLRGSTRYLGSSWNYWGFNLSARGYLPFDLSKRWVLANQFIVDGLIGNAPLAEIVRVGGTLREIAYGGAIYGRGLREEYFPGRVKLINQLELRYRFLDFRFYRQDFDLTAAAFLDAGINYWDWKSPNSLSSAIPIIGTGGGFRLAWNETFVIRLDLAVSPAENFTPRYYLKIGNVF